MARQPQVQPAPPPPEPTITAVGPPEPEANGILTIDLAAIHANYRMLAGRVLPGECGAVVKGDGYGCGIDEVTTTRCTLGLLAQAASTFSVPRTAGSTRSRSGSLASKMYGLAA